MISVPKEKCHGKLVSNVAVDKRVGQILAKEMGASFIETSAKNSENVEESFIQMACELVKRQYMLHSFISVDR